MCPNKWVNIVDCQILLSNLPESKSHVNIIMIWDNEKFKYSNEIEKQENNEIIRWKLRIKVYHLQLKWIQFHYHESATNV